MDINENKDQKDQPNIDEEKIKEELYGQYKSLLDQVSGYGSADQINPDVLSGNKKLIYCRHEIIFNINARVMEEDELGNHVATTAICTKNYHIPVPSDKDYNIYMDAFFKHLESCLSQSAQHSSNKKEETNG
jgi:uncharacterized protein (UPF0297 family)